jgi:conjugative transfer region protein TrbK
MTRVLVWGTALIILLGAALLAGRASQGPSAAPVAVASRDPDLARCRDLGTAALDDPACRAAWAAARARFFDGGRS